MALSSKKANGRDHIDRISDLPSNVIDVILQHLNIRDLVRTSILSTKWRYMWISVPQLEFDEDFLNMFDHFDDPGPEISKIITEVLFVHNGPVYKFTLRIPYGDNIMITNRYFNMWIMFLSRRGIKCLELVDRSLDPQLDPEQMPCQVFSCQELTYLILGGFHLSIPPNFSGFKSLLVLHLEYITLNSGALRNLISGCPLLEELRISFCNGFKCIDFSAPTVKVLRIEDDEFIDSICLKKVNNLIDLTILADVDMVSDLIKSLPNIQNLDMETFVKKILYANINPLTRLINSFSSLEYLTLTVVNLNDREELLHIVSLLKNAPNLVDLVIESHHGVVHYPSQVSDHSEEFECSGCCFTKLQRVDISVKAMSKHAMSLIRFILRHSPSLETLIIDVFGFSSNKSDAAELFSISQDLLRMQRASQRAVVEFLPR